jgi:hypothetical protein
MAEMTLEDPTEARYRRALKHLDKILADPVEVEKRIDRAIAGWRKKRNYRRSSTSSNAR